LTKLHKNILPVICFSASKTFTIYGIRTGAQIILARSQQEAAGLKCEAANVARAT
jgi:aspartate/tyrosine/aromatic aminotransferase